MRSVKMLLEHYMNPLHCYCRLRDFGLNASFASKVCGFYERFIYRPNREVQ